MEQENEITEKNIDEKSSSQKIKKNKPGIVLPNFEDYIKNETFSFETINVVQNIIELILDRGAEKLYKDYLITKLPEFLSKESINIKRNLIEVNFLKAEKGENKFNYLNSWIEDEEPVNIIFSIKFFIKKKKK